MRKHDAPCGSLQIDLAFAEVDAVDITSRGFGCVIGRVKENAQPELPRFRAVAKKSDTFVALLHSSEQVRSASAALRLRTHRYRYRDREFGALPCSNSGVAQAVCGLEGSVPVVVEAENWEDVAEELDDLVVGAADIWCDRSSTTYNTRMYTRAWLAASINTPATSDC